MRAMKDSGIAWIGEIPEDWEIKKLKYTFFHSNAGEVIDKSYWNCGSELLYTCQKEPINSNYSGFPEAKRTGINDLLLTRNATPYVFIPETHSIYSNVVQRISLRQEYDRRYIRYSLLSAIDSLVALGDTIPSYNMEIWENITLPIMQQQHRIADYLDHKCSQIDAIIARQQEVIEKLKAYKLSRINEIVVEVEGITAHLGYVSNMKNGLNFNVVPDGKTLKFLGVGDFKDHYVLDSEEMFSDILIDDKIDSDYMLQSGDIIFVRSNGSKELVGRAVMVENVTFPLSYSGFCIRFRNLKTDILKSKYLLYFFRSPYFRKQLEKYSQGSNITNINQVLLSQISIIIPPIKVQDEAIRRVEKLLEAINKLIKGKQEIVSALERYKKSLIYEVVTGKKEV